MHVAYTHTHTHTQAIRTIFFSATIRHQTLVITLLPTVAGLPSTAEAEAGADERAEADDLALIPADDRARVVENTGGHTQP